MATMSYFSLILIFFVLIDITNGFYIPHYEPNQSTIDKSDSLDAGRDPSILQSALARLNSHEEDGSNNDSFSEDEPLHIYVKISPDAIPEGRKAIVVDSEDILGNPPPDTCSSEDDTVRRPSMCYQCSSSHTDKEPVCDHVLWRFARRVDKYKLRLRCPHVIGDYCVKNVQEKRGIRLTERGCFGPGPLKLKDGTTFNIREGCITYRQDGFLTTTCFCKGELCNDGNSFKCSLGLFAMLSLITAITGLTM